MSLITKEHLSLAIQAMKNMVANEIEDKVPASATDEDMLQLLSEMDIVQPLANANNSVYVDANNKVYVL